MDSNSTLSLQANLYPHVTPAGAFYAVTNKAGSASRTLLANILKSDGEAITKRKLLEWAQTNDLEAALSLLYRMQRLEFVFGDDVPAQMPVVKDNTLAKLLPQLSESQKALLIDQDGFYFANSGFNHEAAEEVAVLANEAVRLSERHALLIKNNLNIYQNAWGICDPAGQSELTFFPIYVNDVRLILVIGGTPQLHKDVFVSLVYALYRSNLSAGADSAS